jgi:hypothetical protein
MSDVRATIAPHRMSTRSAAANLCLRGGIRGRPMGAVEVLKKLCAASDSNLQPLSRLHHPDNRNSLMFARRSGSRQSTKSLRDSPLRAGGFATSTLSS